MTSPDGSITTSPSSSKWRGRSRTVRPRSMSRVCQKPIDGAGTEKDVAVTCPAPFVPIRTPLPASGMLDLARQFGVNDVAHLAPQAPGSTWYPYSFLMPIPENEPFLSRGLAALDELVAALGDQEIGSERIAVVGFSQGACLGLEF